MKKGLIKKVLSYFTSKQQSEYENIEDDDKKKKKKTNKYKLKLQQFFQDSQYSFALDYLNFLVSLGLIVIYIISTYDSKYF